MTDEEAALLAELRAISNNSSSNDRFVGGEDDTAGEETQKPQHIPKVNSLSTTTTPPATKSSPTTNTTTTTNPVSSNTTTTTATTISPPKRLSTPLASEKEAGKFISDLKVMLHNANGSHAPGMDRRDEDSADGDSTLSSRHSPSSSSFQAEQESALHPSASHSGAGSNGGGGFTSGPKTFKGDNGGMAADDDLLAELKAISTKSSSGDRFAGDENDEENDAAGTSSRPSVPNDPPPSVPKKATPTKKSSLRPPGEVPPWKRKSRNKSIGSKKEADTSDKVPGSQTALPSPTPTPTQAPSATQPEPTPPTGGGFTSGPKTFNGDNGGMAADDDLLAELRAISNKSSVDRFSGGDEDENDAPLANDPVVPVPVAVKKKPTPKKPSPRKSFREPGEVPPWKKKSQSEKDVVDTTDDSNPATDNSANNKAAIPTPSSVPTGGGFTSGLKTFNGDNGGMAADDDLLAELRAISNNSSADRFSGGDDDDENDVKADIPPMSNDSPVVKKKPTPKKSYRAPGEVPPWKRKSRTQSNENTEEHVATSNVKKTDKASTDDKAALPTPTPAPLPADGGGFSSGPKTFSGDRGGTAEDDDLLAELRAISNKSSADRFVGGDEEDDGDMGKEKPSVTSAPSIVKKKSTPKKPSPKKSFRPPGEVPPWKQKAQSKKSMVDTTDDGAVNDQNDTSGVGSKTASQTSAAQVSPPKGGGGFSSGPKTFNGDRGGMAADDDLLAELRAISNQSSADRFSGGDDEDGSGNVESTPPVRKDPPSGKRKPTPKKSSPKKSFRAPGEVPPWKKKGAAKGSPAAPKTGSGGFSSGPKTFNGDRGGMAADDDLLAELKAISAGSSSNRFSEESGEQAETGSTAVPSPKLKVKETIMQPPKQKQSPPKRSFAADTAPTSLPPMTAPVEDEIIITEQTLLSALDSKVWKERKAAYLFLSSNLSGRVESTSEMDVNELLPTLETHLDSLIPKMVKESNAAALDAALSFLVLYADGCVNAGRSEQAFEITKQLCSGSGLSGRPSTLKLAKQLVMKLMEVSREGVSSVHSTVEVLLTDGLASKKPKVVLNSITLVLDACHAFGASSLPVHVITKSAQKMLSHANGTVRDTSIQIFAEICRAVGSKDPLEPVLEIMKSAQLSQLDSILEKDSAPSQPTIGFRHDSTSGGSADMAETLKLEAEKSKQEKFASRPAVNIFKLLPDTEYYSKIKEKKWSEKVGALDILLQCGGQKPYKLEQPSPSIEYAPLISELKSLLGHTHFAVSSRSMAVIGMLSEGVGSKLFPYLKPLIPDLLVFAKDKKLTRASQSCLDSMFGNIVSLDHLLEKEDSLPSTLDEKEQKNALVRKSAIEFLKRCVERSETAGPRGAINVDIAERIVQLASRKLNDSDASVRGEATQLLKVMLGHKEKEISDVCQRAIQVLQDTNPRLYKSLQSNSKSATGPGGAPPLSPTKKKQRSALPKKQGGTKKPGGAKPAGKRPIPKKQTKNSQAQLTNSDILANCDEGHIPPYEDAITSLTCLNIPNWNKEEDEGGIVSGLQASNWKFRKEAIDQMEAFTKSKEAIAAGSTYPSNVVVFLRQNTREFKESNFNILKAVMEVLIAICESFCSSTQHILEVWICRAAVTIAIGKVSDKKLSETSYQLLSSLCEVQSPEIIFALCLKGLETIKSPLPREGFSLWSITFFQDFGVKALGSGLSTFVNWAVNDCASTNIRVKKAAISAIGEIHKQVGPMMKAVVNSNTNVESSVKEMIEKELASFPYNPSSSSGDRKRKAPNPKGSKSQSSGGGDSDEFMVPKTDFVASLPDDCMVNLGIKEGKDAWKKRKAALEDIEAACGQYKCLISTTPSCMKSLIDLCRALRLRLSDSQSNLKPLAARNIASLLNAIDAPSQAKLGKFIYAPLINAAMNDNKKPMREAAIDAIKLGTTKMDTEGGEVNPAAMDCFMAALVSELNDGFKAIGLPQVLDFTIERAKFFTPIDSLTSVKAASQEAQFASSMISCLVSSKAEARSKAEQVLTECLQFGTVNPSSIEKAILKLNTAEQRTARNIFPSLDVNVSTTTKPNESTPSRRVSRKSRVEDRKSISRNRKRSQSRTRPISSRNGRDSLTSSNKNSDISASSFTNILSDSTSNPLRSLNGVGPSKSQRLSMSRSRDNWPEYPEEPTGSGVLASLKKSWGSHLPTSSISFLFPEKGIQKQEDASSGCELLSHSLSISDKDDGDNFFIEQLDFVNKWLAYAICCRESTVGMQTLISFLLKMFSSLRQKRYQMSDSESTILLPFLLEKAGAAKGRFREMLHDLLSTISSDEIIPMATYGSIICVSVMDRSSVSKARALAARECQRCVEKYGLPAIGKKGIQVTARGISEEHIAENKTAFLDLIEEIVYKMNGDIQRYIKACGNANLSNRARDTIESRLSKQNRSKQVSQGNRSSQRTKSRQRPSSRLSMSSTRNAQETPTQITTKRRTSLSPTRANDSNQEGEFPSLNLKLGEYRENATEEMSYGQNQNGQEGPFTFSFSTPNRQRSDNVSDSTSNGGLNKGDEYKSNESTYEEPESTSKEPTSSAAASLRARLKQLRNKHKPTSEGEIKSSSALSPRASHRTSPTKDKTLFNEIMKDVDELLSRPTPLADPDSNSSALGGLRKIHSSLTKTSSASDDPVLLEDLRNDIKKNASLCVKRLSAVLDFGFRCGSQTSAEALSIPLLSVAIAALMAIFMDPELSALISKDSLCKVIHQSTYSLLDRRLAGSSDYEHILDASTCKKMVKAINKLAIQATYGAKRHVSLQALHSLQIKFCESSVNEDISATDASNTNNRMSRIITKLFSRVLKAEEGNTIPFSSAGVDLKVVFSSIDEVLTKCKSVHLPNSNIANGDAVTMDFVKDDRMVPCFTMARTLMIHILKVKKERDEIDQVTALLRNHGLLYNEFTGRLFTLCRREMGFEKRSPERISPSSRTTRSTSSEAEEISQLLLNVGNAESDSDRSRALHELKVFLASNRNVDLESHLSRLSAPFRKYIQNELQSPQLKPSSKASSRSLLSGFSSKTSLSNLSFDSEISKSNVSMSQKLAYLKSKINAAEATAQSVILPSSDAALSPTSTGTPQLSPTSTSNGGSPQKNSRLRERLAAASEERSRRSLKSTQSTKSTDSYEGRGSLETGAVGNAAALRARLESVRRMSTASRGSSKYA